MGKISKIHNMLLKKEASCTELTNKYLEEIKKSNESINAYVNITKEQALKTAAEVDKKILAGEEISPLEGIPMALKDNISTKDIKTTCCSKMLLDYKPIYDATSWEILKNQNAILLGKTNMDEFAMGSSCETSYFGGTTNPHNKERCSGGSSGGIAAAVSSNIAAYGLGSDTGGSIRQPSSFCGVVGFKPTYGAISRYGLIAYASSFDQIGTVTSSVEDAALVYDAISLKDNKDSTSQGKMGKDSTDQLKKDIKGLKIGIINDYLDIIDEDVKNSILKAIKTYEDLGAEIVYFDMPVLKYSAPVYYILASAEASSNLGRFDGIRYGYITDSYNNIHEMMSKTRSEGFGKEVKKRILLGTYVLSSGYYDAYYKKAQNLRGEIIKGFEEIFEKSDVVLAPTAPTTAFKKGQVAANPIKAYETDVFTVPVNIAGLPAVSIPCGLGKDNMPIGMQLIGNKFEEGKVLNAAYKYQEAAKEDYNLTKWGVQL